MRRTGFLATLAAGVALVVASLHGMTIVDRTLMVAAAPRPAPVIAPEFVLERRDCHREREPRREHGRRV